MWLNFPSRCRISPKNLGECVDIYNTYTIKFFPPANRKLNHITGTLSLTDVNKSVLDDPLTQARTFQNI